MATGAIITVLIAAYAYPVRTEVGGVTELTWTKTGGFIGLDEKLIIRADGTVEYTSNRFGSADLLLDKAEAAELFRETGFFSAEQRYTAKSGAADYYSNVLTVQVEFDVKSVGWVDAWASNEPMPSELGALQLHLESIVERARKQAGPSGDALQSAVTIAKDFLVQTSTFRFDGIPETLRVADAVTLESFPEQHVVTLTFDSRHAGYGLRTLL